MEHRNIPEDGLHEPKGVSLAPSSRVYRSDGSGSGEWSQVDANTLSGGITNATEAGRIVLTDEGGSFVSEEAISSDLVEYEEENLSVVIQELKNRIESLESRVDALENPE